MPLHKNFKTLTPRFITRTLEKIKRENEQTSGPRHLDQQKLFMRFKIKKRYIKNITLLKIVLKKLALTIRS